MPAPHEILAVDAPEALEPGLITAALTSGGLDVAVTAVEREPVGTGQMASCHRLRLTYGRGDGPASLVAKIPSPDPDTRAAGATTYATEVGFYRDVAPTVAVDVPRCYHGSLADDGRFLLLLEDMAPAEQGDQIRGCSPEQAHDAVVNLAGLHGPRWCDPTVREIDCLAPVADDTGFLRDLLVDQTDAFVDRLDVDPADAAVLRDFARRSPAWVSGRPERFSLVHNDYRLDNLLFAPDRGPRPVTAVDWQVLGVGLPARDLAFLLVTGLTTADRREHERALAAAYHDALAAQGVDGYPFDELWDDYRFGTFQGPLITVLGAMVAARTERGDEMFRVMASRSAAAIRDLEALELIPAP